MRLYCNGVEAGGKEGHEIDKVYVGGSKRPSDERPWQC
jgi:hypothetical protein